MRLESSLFSEKKLQVFNCTYNLWTVEATHWPDIRSLISVLLVSISNSRNEFTDVFTSGQYARLSLQTKGFRTFFGNKTIMLTVSISKIGYNYSHWQAEILPRSRNNKRGHTTSSETQLSRRYTMHAFLSTWSKVFQQEISEISFLGLLACSKVNTLKYSFHQIIVKVIRRLENTVA